MAANQSTANVHTIRPVDVDTIRRRAGRARDRLYDAQAIMSVAGFAALAECQDCDSVDPAEIRRAYRVAHDILNETIDALDETTIAKPTNAEECENVRS